MRHVINSLKITTLLFILSISVFAQSAKVSGKVSYNNATPLHDATVQITQLKQSVTTDESGFYEFTNVPPGRYTILVHIEGFADASRVVILVGNASATVDFDMKISSLREEVTVTASGTEQSVFDSFQTVNSVGQTRIAEKGATSLGEVLENETGVAKRSFGPGSSRPVVRGFDGDRVLVLQNGLRNGSVGSQSGDHGEPVDPASAERIEVVKGPATLLYGSNALGGVVNVIGSDENNKHEGVRGFFSALGSTADRQGSVAGGVEYGFRNWVFRGNLNAQRTGDYETPIGRIFNSAARSNGGTFGLGYYADRAYLNGAYSFDLRRYGIPFAPLFEAEEKAERLTRGILPVVEEAIDLDMRRHSFRLGGGFRNLENPFLNNIQYNLDYTDYRHREIETTDGVDTVGTIFDNKIFSYRTQLEQSAYKKLTGRFGFEGFSRDYEVNGAEQLIQGNVKQNMFSVFGLEELNFERVKFQFGGRVESNRYRAQNPALRDRQFTGFSGAIGMNVALWKGGAFVVNYSNSYRAPALEELYNNGPHIGNVTFEIGNYLLKRERANGIDFSLRHLSDRFRITGDVFYYRIKDFVFLAPQDADGDGEVDIIDGLPVARYSQSAASYFGAELSADATFNKYVGGFLSLDYVRAKLVDENINLPRIPPFRARVGLDFRYRDFSVRPEAVFADEQEKIFPLETRTPGYGILNVAGSYTVARIHLAHIFTFNAYNLTGKLYRNHLSFIKEFAPEIGRGIRFGYTIRFF
jgi:iron complex outermembrane recepter protein